MVILWQHGWGSQTIWGIQATRAINVEMPIVVSMNYQVFILSRMREAFDRTGSTDAAVVEGIGRTSRLVTSAARHWNWWLPRRAARILRISPTPAPASA